MHGLQTIVFLSRSNSEAAAHLNASDPGRNEQRRAEADLAEALARIANDVFSAGPCDGCPDMEECDAEGASVTEAPQTVRRFPPDFSVIRHGDAAWALPLTANGRTVAGKVIPTGTPRYGLHYILTGTEGLAIAASLEAACK